MQHGVACISTSEGGIPDIIDDGETGFLIERYNPEQLADRIEFLLNNPNLMEEFGRQGRKRFEEKFGLSVFEKTISDILGELVALG